MPEQIDANIEQQIITSVKLIRILLSFFLFTVVVLALLPQSGILKPQPSNPQTSLMPVFLLISIFLAVNGFVLKRVLLKTNRYDDLQQQTRACIKSFHLSHLISFIVFESIGLLGFVNYILSNNADLSLLFAAISVLCMFIAWPKSQTLKNQITSMLK